MKKHYVFLVLVLLIGTLFLAGCGAQQTTGTADQNTLEKVIVNNKVRVGVLTDYAPWGSRGVTGEYEGFDIDIAYALGEALGVEVELVSVEAPARIPSLVADKIDVIIGCLTPTNERAKTVAFTLPYASAGLVIMTWADTEDIDSYKDLAGKTVAIVRGGTPDIGMTKFAPDADTVRYDSIADAFTAFQSGRADAFVEEDLYVYFQVGEDDRFKAVGEPFMVGLIAFGVKQNDQAWLNYLNNFITNLRFSGEHTELYEKWFGHPPGTLVIP